MTPSPQELRALHEALSTIDSDNPVIRAALKSRVLLKLAVHYEFDPVQEAREWLEENGDYEIAVHVLSNAGPYSGVLGRFEGESLTYSTGLSLEKHIGRVLRRLKEHKEARG